MTVQRIPSFLLRPRLFPPPRFPPFPSHNVAMRRALLLAALAALPALAQQPVPMLPSGADPWVLYKDGWYFYMHTTGRNLALWRTRHLSDLAQAEQQIIFTPPEGAAISKQLWAPEIHFLRGKWYVYFAADDGRNRNHRLYVLENFARDPFEGKWRFRGKLALDGDKWAIDGSAFEHRGRLYFLWSGWEGDENGRQDIYLSRLKNPWTAEGPRVRISTPELPWERVGDIPKPGPDDKPHVDVNEGPEVLIRNGRVFVVYSASGCWTDSYALGMIYASDSADLMNPKSWTKSPQPVFQADGSHGVWAAGHNSFTTSPDGRQDWIVYHANPGPGLGCGGRRAPFMQPFSWSADGFPVFGAPAPAVQIP